MWQVDLSSASSAGVLEHSVLLPHQLWGRSGHVTMDETLSQEAFVFYLKKRFTLAKKALPRHRKEMGPEVSHGE